MIFQTVVKATIDATRWRTEWKYLDSITGHTSRPNYTEICIYFRTGSIFEPRLFSNLGLDGLERSARYFPLTTNYEKLLTINARTR